MPRSIGSEDGEAVLSAGLSVETEPDVDVPALPDVVPPDVDVPALPAVVPPDTDVPAVPDVLLPGEG
jgi:hypothetical protein